MSFERSGSLRAIDLIFAVLLTIFITVFWTSDNFYPWEHEAATKSCTNNGGYVKISYDLELFQSADPRRYIITCKDGAEFSYNYKEFESLAYAGAK